MVWFVKTFPTIADVMLGAVWLVAVIFLWYYLKGVRAHLNDFRKAWGDCATARRERTGTPEVLRGVLIGEAVSFGGMLLLATLAGSIAVSGIAWFLTQVIGGLVVLFN